jgi:hypothetical protein
MRWQKGVKRPGQAIIWDIKFNETNGDLDGLTLTVVHLRRTGVMTVRSTSHVYVCMYV